MVNFAMTVLIQRSLGITADSAHRSAAASGCAAREAPWNEDSEWIW